MGLAILNDCKYGYSVRDQTIGLSLLKAGEFPYEKTDKQEHEFVYSMMAFSNTESVWEQASRLNTPLWAIKCTKVENKPLIKVSESNIHVLAFKRAEKDTDKYVLRLAEVYGQETFAKVEIDIAYKKCWLSNGLEDEINEINFGKGILIKPFKI